MTVEDKTNVTTTTARTLMYPSQVIHKARDTYVLMATITVFLIALAFVVAFMHRKCRNSFSKFKRWMSGKSSPEGDTPEEDTNSSRHTTSGRSTRINSGLDHSSSEVHNKEICPSYCSCNNNKALKLKQKILKDRLNTMNTIQEDINEEDSGISVISTSPLPKHYVNYDSELLRSGTYRNTPITVEHDGCLIRVLAPESFTEGPGNDIFRNNSLGSSRNNSDNCIRKADLISSKHSSVASFLQDGEHMRRNSSYTSDYSMPRNVSFEDLPRRNSSFSSLDEYTHIDLDDCHCCQNVSCTDLSVGSSKYHCEVGSNTNLSNVSVEPYLYDRHSSFESLTSNELYIALNGTCKRHSLKPKLEAKDSFDSVSTETILNICDRDSCIDIMERHFDLATDDTSVSGSDSEIDEHTHSKEVRAITGRQSGKDNCGSGYDNAAFEFSENGYFIDNRHQNGNIKSRPFVKLRCDSESDFIDSSKTKRKRKLHRVSRSKSLPNWERHERNRSSKLEHLPDIII